MSIETKQRKRQAEVVEGKAAKVAKKAKKETIETPESSDVAAASEPAKAKQSSAKSAAVMDAAAFRKAHDITVQHLGTETAGLYQTFEDAPFSKGVQQALKASGFTSPTPIQVSSELVN